MKPFKPPKRKSPYPDRDIDCQEAIEAGFQHLVQNVAAVGWGPAEIAEAIEQLAMADRRAREENAKVDATLQIAKAMAAAAKS
jgi:hypothetical protein